jgi:hypothetical protein
MSREKVDMTFICPEEFAIFMDIPQANGQRVSVDDLKRLHDAGIQTAFMHGTKRDYLGTKDIENNLGRYRNAGMKAIIPLWNFLGNVYPADYYAHDDAGTKLIDVFSPWNRDAYNTYLNWLDLYRQHFSSDDCLIITAQARDGEYVMPQEPAFYDDAAIADWRDAGHDGQPDITNQETHDWLKATYTRLLMDQQRILVQQPDQEIWFMLSHKKALACRPEWQKISDIGIWMDDKHMQHIGAHPRGWAYGCEWIDDYLTAFQELKPAQINHISYNYFPFGQSYWDKIKQDRDVFGMQEWAGAEYASGLRDGNGRLAVEHGLRGIFIGPTHPYTGLIGIQDWMLDEIKKVGRLFEEVQWQ